MDTIVRQAEVYRRALDALGKPFPDEFPCRREVFVAATREEAMRLARPHLEGKYEVYRSWGQDREMPQGDRKSTRLNSSPNAHLVCRLLLEKKKLQTILDERP